MSDIIERLRQNARSEDCFNDPYPDVLIDAADEIDRLRARVAELEAQRDAAFKMSRCECDSDEACRNLAALHWKVAELETEKENFDHAKSYIVDLEAKIVELEAARGGPVAWMLKTGHGTAFATVKPECEIDLWVPLYIAPTALVVDVDSISDDRIKKGLMAFYGDDAVNKADSLVGAILDMRTAIRAIFNTKDK